MENYLIDNPTTQFFLVVAAFIAFMLFLRWLAPRIRYQPTDDHNPSDHHWWGMGCCVLGLLALVGVIVLGFGEPIADAAEEVVDNVADIAEEVLE